jgi:hypothetical protein
MKESKIQTAEESKAGVYTHTLKKPFTYAEKTHEKFTFDFDKLSGNDYLAVEKQLRDEGETSVNMASTRFICEIASRASGIGSDVFIALPIVEFNNFINKIYLFLANKE